MMSPSELLDWLLFINHSPEPLREYLSIAFWVLVSLILMWFILKIIFTNEFTKLYAVISALGKQAGKIGRNAMLDASKNIQLPEPYPRFAKVIKIICMIVGYLGSVCFFLCAVTVSLNFLFYELNIWNFIFELVVILTYMFFGLFFFAQSEKDRVNMRRRGDSERS